MDYTIYISQAIAILFAFVLAKHDGAAVNVFEATGISELLMARFHRYNVWVKIAFCLLAALSGLPDPLNMGFLGVLSFLWIYLVFDIALNKSRPGRSWDHLGTNDADGRRWVKWFGENAGERKALILVLIIAEVNVLLLILK